VVETASFKERVLIFLISRLGALIIWLEGKTWRLRWEGHEHVRVAWAKGENVIYTFWHGHLLALCFSHRRQKIHVMVSEHRDGEIIAQIIQLLGFVPVRGSTTRGGLKALLKIAERASAGYDVAITPDGPKGPRERVQPGVITLAQRTGMPIIPLASAASFRKNLSSWDRFLIPLPFSRVAILEGSPIYVPRDLSERDVEEKRKEVEQTILALTREAGELCQ
jgi:lysophospholipid acyltransferase (LPLAT)-like uncharacterized protein